MPEVSFWRFIQQVCLEITCTKLMQSCWLKFRSKTFISWGGLFDERSDECLSWNKRGTCSETGKLYRNSAKLICIQICHDIFWAKKICVNLINIISISVCVNE